MEDSCPSSVVHQTKLKGAFKQNSRKMDIVLPFRMSLMKSTSDRGNNIRGNSAVV